MAGSSIATGLMAETISNSTSHMTDADLEAIATYLKDEPSPATSENVVPVASGQADYESRRPDLR